MTDLGYAVEVEVLANERFAAVGGALLAALAESGLSARRCANVLGWFVVAQLALGPWRSRGEVRPAALAARMGVSRWTECRARRDAVSAGVIRDWSLPDPEARGYGRGAVRVVELAFVRTRAITQKVAAFKEERATRAERRRADRARAKVVRRDDRVVTPATPTSDTRSTDEAPTVPLALGDLTGPAAGQLWSMLQRVQARAGPAGPDPPSPARTRRRRPGRTPHRHENSQDGRRHRRPCRTREQHWAAHSGAARPLLPIRWGASPPAPSVGPLAPRVVLQQSHR